MSATATAPTYRGLIQAYADQMREWRWVNELLVDPGNPPIVYCVVADTHDAAVQTSWHAESAASHQYPDVRGVLFVVLTRRQLEEWSADDAGPNRIRRDRLVPVDAYLQRKA